MRADVTKNERYTLSQGSGRLIKGLKSDVQADVYITNQLPRVRRKLRTEPADLFAINPTLVFAKGHGQGQRGPQSQRPRPPQGPRLAPGQRPGPGQGPPTIEPRAPQPQGCWRQPER